MRFAFVTTEFPTTLSNAGGLANYVARMSRLLAEAGHDVHIFVPVDDADDETPWNGCKLHHVQRDRRIMFRLVNWVLLKTGFSHLTIRRRFVSQAQAVAAAIGKCETEAPFDVVQSADYRGISIGLTSRPGRLNVVRCSSAIELYMASNARKDRSAAMEIALEEESIRRADFVFAPSQLTARHYQHKLGRDIHVLPTPIYLEEAALERVPADLPPRYLLHFAGKLGKRKGTHLLAEALPLALVEAPDLIMVCAGRVGESLQTRLMAGLGARAHQLICLPPQGKAALYALIKGAICTVLPSRIDNLPNSVLESLMLGTPVIGSQDSSIEELVEDGVTGLLIPNGSAPDLAAAMVRAWRGEMKLQFEEPWAESRIGRAFQPEVALDTYLAAITAARNRLALQQSSEPASLKIWPQDSEQPG